MCPISNLATALLAKQKSLLKTQFCPKRPQGQDTLLWDTAHALDKQPIHGASSSTVRLHESGDKSHVACAKIHHILDHKAGLNKFLRTNIIQFFFPKKSAAKTVIIKREKKPLYILEFYDAHYKIFMGTIRQEEIKGIEF